MAEPHPNSTETSQFLGDFFRPLGLSKINVLINASNPREFRAAMAMMDLGMKLYFITLGNAPDHLQYLPKYETLTLTSKEGVVMLSNTKLAEGTVAFVSKVIIGYNFLHRDCWKTALHHFNF